VSRGVIENIYSVIGDDDDPEVLISALVAIVAGSVRRINL